MPESVNVADDVISKLHEVDPVFREVVGLLYGDAVDPREAYDIAKRDSPEAKAKRERRQAQVALGTNIVGLTAGGLGTAAALKDDRFADPAAPKVMRRIHRKASKINITPKAGRAGAYTAAGALGVQTINLGGDAIANRVLSRSAKKPDREVRKAWDEGLSQIVAKRRDGVITTQQGIDMALELAEELSKGAWAGRAGRAHRMVNPIARANHRTRVAEQVARDSVNRAAQAKKRTRRVASRAGAAGYARGVTASPAGRAVAGAAVGGGAVGVGGTLGGQEYARRRRLKPTTIEATQVSTHNVTKREDEELVDYGFSGEIAKFDTDKRLAFGWCSLSEVDGQPVVDLQNDWAPIEEIEKSAYAYVMESRKGGDMHERDGEGPRHTADLVESMIVTPDKLEQMGLPSEVAKSMPVGWWVGFKVKDDKQWELVKKRERTGFSIHGKGSRVSKVLT